MEYKIEIVVYQSIMPMIDWSTDNIGKIDEKWTCSAGGGVGTTAMFNFYSNEDAMAFKLRWL